MKLARVSWRVALLATAFSASSAGAAEIVELVPVIRENRIFISFRAEGAFDERIAHEIETGLAVTFRYNVQLKQVRRLWFDRVAAWRSHASHRYIHGRVQP